MDPDENLKNQLKLAKRILDGRGSEDDLIFDATELAELVENLNDWLSRRGFLPKRWNGRR